MTTARAAMFPGQGAQTPGMGRDWVESDPAARGWFDRASAVLGWDLARICFEGPAAELTRSDRAQPAIFVVSAVVWDALRRTRPDIEWTAAAGLSSGEWAALFAAGALSFEDTLRVLEARGRFMQEACEQNPGAMLSVLGLPLPVLERVCAECGAEIANLNAPDQTVLSGGREAIDAAERLANAAGARRTIRLNVAGAFHSSLMRPAADRLRQFLADIPFRAPSLPVFSNVTGRPHGGPEEIREAMVRQVTDSVRWVDCVLGMRELGARVFIECGPGRVLCGLAKRIDKSLRALNISSFSDLKGMAETL